MESEPVKNTCIVEQPNMSMLHLFKLDTQLQVESSVQKSTKYTIHKMYFKFTKILLLSHYNSNLFKAPTPIAAVLENCMSYTYFWYQFL